MYKYILKENELNIWEEKYGCTNKYICVLEFYLMTII